MSIWIHALIIVISGIVIYYLGEKFADSSSKIGDYFKLSRSVKGATFDAMASSMPEFLVALFSVILFKKFEVGIGTIAGSALFNLLVIPGICVLIAPKLFKVTKDVVHRDALFYVISVFVLMVLLIYFETWGIVIALFLIGIYLVYIKEISRHHKNEKKKNKGKETNIGKEIFMFFLTMAGMGLATYFLTGSSIAFAEILNVPAVIVAFTITAGATSVPDTVVSTVNAKKGSLSDATSNIFGSNIFDIAIGLGVPLLIYSIIVNPLEIAFNQIEIIIGLMGATIIVLYFMAEDEKLSKKQGIFLLVAYLAFLAYVIFLSL